jgi:hypothetical protein
VLGNSTTKIILEIGVSLVPFQVASGGGGGGGRWVWREASRVFSADGGGGGAGVRYNIVDVHNALLYRLLASCSCFATIAIYIGIEIFIQKLLLFISIY